MFVTKSSCLARLGKSIRYIQSQGVAGIPEEEIIKVKQQQEIVLKKYFPKADNIDEKSINCIESRQRFAATPDLFAVDKERCQYGFPRVYLRYPYSKTWQTGFIRLTCPHLVKAVDRLEAKGGLERFDQLLNDKDNPQSIELKENFLQVNNTWNKIFNDLVTDFIRTLGLESFCKRESFKNLFNTGFIGISKDDVDQVKCLHAHLADHLIRGDNKIGELVEKELESKGVSTQGCGGEYFYACSFCNT